MRSYTNPLGKGRRVWSGKNTPSRGSPGSAPATLRHGDNVESLIDAKFAKWQEEQLAMFRGVLGPALPAQLPPGLPLRSLETQEVSGADFDLPDGDIDLESQAKSAPDIYDLYDNSLCPDVADSAPKESGPRGVSPSGPGSASPGLRGVAPIRPGNVVEVDSSRVQEMVASSPARTSQSALTKGQVSLEREHPTPEMVASSLAPGALVGRQMVASSVSLGKSDPPMGVRGETSPGTLLGPQDKAVDSWQRGVFQVPYLLEGIGLACLSC